MSTDANFWHIWRLMLLCSNKHADFQATTPSLTAAMLRLVCSACRT
jgi:hypothetical protein